MHLFNLLRSTSPWTDLVEVMPYEKRQFPLTDEEMVELEVDS